jgi:hypothetical protein
MALRRCGGRKHRTDLELAHITWHDTLPNVTFSRLLDLWLFSHPQHNISST